MRFSDLSIYDLARFTLQATKGHNVVVWINDFPIASFLSEQEAESFQNMLRKHGILAKIETKKRKSSNKSALTR